MKEEDLKTEADGIEEDVLIYPAERETEEAENREKAEIAENAELPGEETAPSGEQKNPLDRAQEKREREPQQGPEELPGSNAAPPAHSPAERDRAAEWQALAEAHPEVVGTQLPEDIYRACMESSQPPLQVYESMMLKKLGAELETLKKENELLRRNAETAAHAPVTGTSGGSVPEAEPEDPFIRAFRDYK